MAIVHEVFAYVHEETVQNVVVCDDYATADHLAKCIYGPDAFAVDCLQYRCGIGDKYHDGSFWAVDSETNEEIQIPYTPTQEMQVSALRNETKRLQTENNDTTLIVSEIIGGGLFA